MPIIDMVKTINKGDQKVAVVVGTQDDKTAQTIGEAAKNYSEGGRLIYIGAGASGRLGVLDAAELALTYGIKSERAIGLIADGKGAMYVIIEGAEDSRDLTKRDLKDPRLNKNDIVLGLAASGCTSYVIGDPDYAKAIGALTISIARVKDPKIGHHADIAIEAAVGPEVITGSARMKAGTAQKTILNMISIGVTIKRGKVFENATIDVKPTNSELIDHACRIIQTTTGISTPEARNTPEKASNDVGLAVVTLKTNSDLSQAKNLLRAENGNVVEVLSKQLAS